jgi:two-component system, sensor histidine kinase FlrB
MNTVLAQPYLSAMAPATLPQTSPQTGPQIDKASLQTAFEQFNRLSAQLSDSYLVLERQIGVLHDELQYERAERSREHDEKVYVSLRFDTLLDLLPGGVVVLDQTGMVMQCNPAAVELLGSPLSGERWINVITRSFAPRKDDGHEISLKDGRRVSIATRSLGDQPGQIILLTDQTETRALQATFSRQQRLVEIGRMMSSLAHQIRTPLSAAMLYASHLANEALTPQQTARFSQKILSRLNDLERQVKDMLLFVRGDIALTDCVTLGVLFREVEQAAEVEVRASGAQLIIENTAADEKILCNTPIISGAIVNLINNALQAGGRKVCITLASVRVGNNVVISVSDNGPGMDAITQEKIREAFFTTKPQGTGLGLAVVRAVANAHRGDFSLSSAPGAGTLARIELPCIEQKKIELPNIEEAPASLADVAERRAYQ